MAKHMDAGPAPRTREGAATRPIPHPQHAPERMPLHPLAALGHQVGNRAVSRLIAGAPAETIGGETAPAPPLSALDRLSGELQREGCPVEAVVRRALEGTTGQSLAHARLHDSAAVGEILRELGALGAAVGERLLIHPRLGGAQRNDVIQHELAHVLQAARTVQPPSRFSLRRDAGLERDAQALATGNASGPERRLAPDEVVLMTDQQLEAQANEQQRRANERRERAERIRAVVEKTGAPPKAMDAKGDELVRREQKVRSNLASWTLNPLWKSDIVGAFRGLDATEFEALQAELGEQGMSLVFEQIGADYAAELGTLGKIVAGRAVLNEKRSEYIQKTREWGAAAEPFLRWIFDTMPAEDIREVVTLLAQAKRLNETVRRLPSVVAYLQFRGVDLSSIHEAQTTWSEGLVRGLQSVADSAYPSNMGGAELALPMPYRTMLMDIETRQFEARVTPTNVTRGVLSDVSLGMSEFPFGLYDAGETAIKDVHDWWDTGDSGKATEGLVPLLVMVATILFTHKLGKAGAGAVSRESALMQGETRAAVGGATGSVLWDVGPLGKTATGLDRFIGRHHASGALVEFTVDWKRQSVTATNRATGETVVRDLGGLRRPSGLLLAEGAANPAASEATAAQPKANASSIVATPPADASPAARANESEAGLPLNRSEPSGVVAPSSPTWGISDPALKTGEVREVDAFGGKSSESSASGDSTASDSEPMILEPTSHRVDLPSEKSRRTRIQSVGRSLADLSSAHQEAGFESWSQRGVEVDLSGPGTRGKREVTREEQLHGIPDPVRWRQGTPTKLQRLQAQKALPEGAVDPALPGSVLARGAQADHIVPANVMRKWPGFALLSDEGQRIVFNTSENIHPVSGDVNGARKDILYRDWDGKLSDGRTVDPAWLAEMRAREVKASEAISASIERQLKREMQQRWDERLLDHK